MVSFKFLTILATFFIAGYIFFSPYLSNIFFIEGLSMYPTFKGCTIIYADNEINPYLLEKGDIVIINLKGLEQKTTPYNIIVHRVIINNNKTQKIATRGDNNKIYNYTTQVDGFFDYNRVMGKVDKYYNLPIFMCEIRNYPKNFINRF